MLVRVPDVPVDLYFANRARLQEVFTPSGDLAGDLPLSPGDAALMDDLLRLYLPFRDAATAQAAAARDRGDATFVLEVDLPEWAVEDVTYVERLLARVDALAAEQGVTLPASPDVQAFRRELFAAIAEQLRAGA